MPAQTSRRAVAATTQQSTVRYRNPLPTNALNTELVGRTGGEKNTHGVWRCKASHPTDGSSEQPSNARGRTRPSDNMPRKGKGVRHCQKACGSGSQRPNLAPSQHKPHPLSSPSSQRRPNGPGQASSRPRRPPRQQHQHLTGHASGTSAPERTLRVLQYNVERSLDHVMAPLMRDERILEYEAICIQEPWVFHVSDQLSTTHFPTEAKQHSDLFWPSVPAPFTPKVCTLVRRDLSKQLVHFSQHILSVYISEGSRNFSIHNVYNPPLINCGVHDLRDALAKAASVPGENHHLSRRGLQHSRYPMEHSSVPSNPPQQPTRHGAQRTSRTGAARSTHPPRPRHPPASTTPTRGVPRSRISRSCVSEPRHHSRSLHVLMGYRGASSTHTSS